MSTRVYLVLAILTPTVMLLIVGAVVRICLLVFGDERSEQGAETSRGNHVRNSGSVSLHASLSTLARRSGFGHH
jgi:hypothetical protein